MEASTVLGLRVDVALEGELDRDLVLPSSLVEVSESMPAMVENCFSSGVRDLRKAMVSGLGAPGSAQRSTWMVGKSMLGQVAHRQKPVAMIPKTMMSRLSSVVMTGPADEEVGAHPHLPSGRRLGRGAPWRCLGAPRSFASTRARAPALKLPVSFTTPVSPAWSRS